LAEIVREIAIPQVYIRWEGREVSVDNIAAKEVSEFVNCADTIEA
jgi:hypothetical protein